MILDDPGAEDRSLLGERRVRLKVAEARPRHVESRVSLGYEPLRAPEHFSRDARGGLSDEQEIAEIELLPLRRHARSRSAVGQGLE